MALWNFPTLPDNTECIYIQGYTYASTVWCVMCGVNRNYAIQTLQVHSSEAGLMVVAGLSSLLQQVMFQTVFSMCSVASVAFCLQRVEQLSICEC